MAQDAGSIYSEIRVRLDKLGGDVTQVKTHLDQIGTKSTQVANTSEDALGKSFNASKLAGVAAFAAITIAIKSAIDISATFEQSMANVQSVAQGTEAEFRALGDAAMEAGESTRFTASQAADALYSLASAGMSATEAVKALDGVLMLAGSTQSDLATTSASMVATLRQYNLVASESTRVSNVFAAAIGNSMATMEKITSAMTQVGPVASAMGRSIEETVGSLEALYDAGYRGEKAGTALKAILGQLASETDPTIRKIVALGVSFDDINPAVNGLAEVFGTLSEAGLTAGEVMDAFGTRSGGQMLALMSAGRKGIEDYTEAITGTNAAAEMYAIQNDTLQGSLDRLKSAAESAQIKFSNEFKPAMRGVVDILLSLTKIVGNLPGPLKVFFGVLLGGIPIIIGATTALTGLRIALGAVSAPIAIGIAAVAGLTAVFSGLIGQVDKVRTARLEKEFGDLAEKLGITAEEAEKLAIQAERMGINPLDLADNIYGIAITTTQLEALNTTIERMGSTKASVIEYLDEWASQLGITGQEIYRLVLANKNLSDSDREVIKTRLDDVDSMNASHKGVQDTIYAREKLTEADEKAALAIAKKTRLEKAEKAKATENHEKALEELDRINEKVELGVLTEEEANKKRKAIYESYLDSLMDTDRTMKELGSTYIDVSEDIDSTAESINYLSTEEEKAAKKLKDKTEAEQEAIASSDALAASTLDYGNRLKQVGKEGKNLTETQRELEIEKAKALKSSGATDEAIQKNIESINKYYDAVESLADSNSLEFFQQKIEDSTKSSQDLIDAERARAIESVEASDLSADAMEDLIEVFNKFFDALSNKTALESFQSEFSAYVSATTQGLGAISDLFSALYDNRIEDIDRAMQAELEAEGLAEESKTEKAEAELEDVQESNDKQLKAIQTRIDAATLAGDTASANKLKNTKDELKIELDAEEAKKQAIVDKAIIEEKYAKKKAKMEYDAAMWEWRISIAKAIADTAGAVVQALPNIPLSIIAGLIGVTQTAAVIASVPPAPTLATGGIILPSSDGTLTRQAENGYAELSLNAGPSGEALMGNFAQQIVDKMGDSQGGSRQPVVVQLVVDRQVLSQIVADDINNGRVRVGQ